MQEVRCAHFGGACHRFTGAETPPDPVPHACLEAQLDRLDLRSQVPQEPMFAAQMSKVAKARRVLGLDSCDDAELSLALSQNCRHRLDCVRACDRESRCEFDIDCEDETKALDVRPRTSLPSTAAAHVSSKAQRLLGATEAQVARRKALLVLGIAEQDLSNWESAYDDNWAPLLMARRPGGVRADLRPETNRSHVTMGCMPLTLQSHGNNS